MIAKFLVPRYQIAKRVSGGVIVTDSAEFGSQMWSLMTRPMYKNRQCANCGKSISRSTDPAYRPITNRGNRADRICVPCVKKGLGEA